VQCIELVTNESCVKDGPIRKKVVSGLRFTSLHPRLATYSEVAVGRGGQFSRVGAMGYGGVHSCACQHCSTALTTTSIHVFTNAQQNSR